MEITDRRKETNLTYKKVYQLWRNMTQRCTNPKNPYYKNYGQKGVTICDKWLSLNGFIEDVDKIEGFDIELFLQGKLSLDKDIKNSKQYCLESCKFITKEQNNKIKPNQQVKFIAIAPDGKVYESYNQSSFARQHNLSQSKISTCLKENLSYKGWKFEKCD